MTFYDEGRRAGTFEDGIELALRRLLASPQFLVRAEKEPADRAGGPAVPHHRSRARVAPVVLPLEQHPGRRADQPRAARDGSSNPAVLEQQVRRMLADPRSDALVDNFAEQLLYLRNLPATSPDGVFYPGLGRRAAAELPARDGAVLRQHHARGSQRRRSADGRLHVRQRAARAALRHPEHLRIAVPPRDARAGARLPPRTARQGQLSRRSRGRRISGRRRSSAACGCSKTSSARRRRSRRRTCRRSRTRPPGSAEGADAARADDAAPRRIRPCAGCHKIMDPIGFALENFDADGKWRTKQGGDGGTPIDASVDAVATASTSNGPVGLRQALLRYSPQFVRMFTEKMMTYALGRGVEYSDMPVIRVDRARRGRDNNRFSAIVLGIVKSAQFQMRVKAATGDCEEQCAATTKERAHVHHQEAHSRGGRSCAAPASRWRCRCSSRWCRR